MENAIQLLKKQLTAIMMSDLSDNMKLEMEQEYNKAINILEYERYNFVPNQPVADQLNQIKEWTDRWNNGDTKFVPELLGLTKALIMDRAFTETPIEENILEEKNVFEEEIIKEENDESVYVEGRSYEEPKVEGRKTGFLSWFKSNKF